MNGYQKLTKNGLKSAFFTFMRATVEYDCIDDHDKALICATLNAAYQSLIMVDNDDAEQFNSFGEDKLAMLYMDTVFQTYD